MSPQIVFGIPGELQTAMFLRLVPRPFSPITCTEVLDPTQVSEFHLCCALRLIFGDENHWESVLKTLGLQL